MYWSSHEDESQESVDEEYRKYVALWKRPNEIHDYANSTLWGVTGIPNPMAAHPGKAVDNSWFLSAAAALAERPQNIHSIIKNKDTSKEGVYEFTFFINAMPLPAVVDNRLPLTAQELPINAQLTADGAQWLILLEKAFAKISVNYAN